MANWRRQTAQRRGPGWVCDSVWCSSSASLSNSRLQISHAWPWPSCAPTWSYSQRQQRLVETASMTSLRSSCFWVQFRKGLCPCRHLACTMYKEILKLGTRKYLSLAAFATLRKLRTSRTCHSLQRRQNEPRSCHFQRQKMDGASSKARLSL